ncbi:alpha/beta hydrolase [Pacificimonas sp. WHA3]|uniref:Alpha/beta hydrolase n=1 Tax=Pacificimonas pallii TaxID=2827236 RepID=A0ABS6SA60_9SPHN|nr:alpha/beta fold hydrolase [Pacificimonas pallii]MBV7255249.1 alpha/beta hydrolase [Pacificimonas pallii]
MIAHPHPEDRVRLPADGETRYETAADGARLRVMSWPPPAGAAAPAHILFAGGKRDFIERHAETYHRLRGAGYALTAMDWRDQGLSARNSVPDERLFDAMADDAKRVITSLALPAGVPLILMAHSMGGHMMLRVLAEEPDLRHRVTSCVCFAPMLAIGAGPPPWVLGSLAKIQVMLGNGRGRPPGQPAYGPIYKSEERRARLTGDRVRFEEGFTFIDNEAGLAAGGATWGWLAGAHESMAKLRRPGVLERIDVPVLLLVGTDEHVVDADAIMRAAVRLPQGHVDIIARGHHELQLDSDDVQARLWALVHEFFARTGGQHDR